MKVNIISFLVKSWITLSDQFWRKQEVGGKIRKIGRIGKIGRIRRKYRKDSKDSKARQARIRGMDGRIDKYWHLRTN